jgi:hypothetical protein
MDDVATRLQTLSTSDADFLLAIHKSLDFLKEPASHVPEKTINGMKLVLFRIAMLPPGKNHNLNKGILKKWYEQKMASEKMWEKPKNPYLS